MNLTSRAQRIVGSLLRRTPFFVYVSWVLFGFRTLLGNQDSKPVRFRYIATAALPANHLMRTQDFMADVSIPKRDQIWLPKPSDFEGKYLEKAIPQGGVVDSSNLRSTPSLTPTSDRITYLFSLDHQPLLSDLLNAGSAVRVCRPDKCDQADIRVLAVLCSASKKDACSVALDLAPAQAALFSDADKVRLAPR